MISLHGKHHDQTKQSEKNVRNNVQDAVGSIGYADCKTAHQDQHCMEDETSVSVSAFNRSTLTTFS